MQEKDVILKAKRELAIKHNPTLAKLVDQYYQETKDDEFLNYMQTVIDCYMMHECYLVS